MWVKEIFVYFIDFVWHLLSWRRARNSPQTSSDHSRWTCLGHVFCHSAIVPHSYCHRCAWNCRSHVCYFSQINHHKLYHLNKPARLSRASCHAPTHRYILPLYQAISNFLSRDGNLVPNFLHKSYHRWIPFSHCLACAHSRRILNRYFHLTISLCPSHLSHYQWTSLHIVCCLSISVFLIRVSYFASRRQYISHPLHYSLVCLLRLFSLHYNAHHRRHPMAI